MGRITRANKLGIAAACAALLGACAALGPPELTTYPYLQPGSTWTVQQQNTGSYGRDSKFEVTRIETTFEGRPAIAFVNGATGNSIMATREEARWMAIVDKAGKKLMTYDPPIGFPYPLKVGKDWSTKHRFTNLVNGTSFEIAYNCKVESFDKVAVAVGTFDAYRIACSGPGYQDTYWFSPDFGMQLKFESVRTADSPMGPGTQRTEVVALNVRR